MKYLFTKGQHTEQLEGGGTFTIDAGSVRRWTYQMNTSYAELPENMKPSDREEARKIIAIIEAGLVEVE